MSALDRVQNLLARRDHSEKELLEKLDRHHDHEESLAAVEYAKEAGWTAPPEELSHKVLEELNRRSKGGLYILNYLKKKGLPSVNIDEDIEVEKAQQLVLKLVGHRSPFSETEQRKVANALKNRGFFDSVTRKVLYDKR
jgi:regulatory protein